MEVYHDALALTSDTAEGLNYLLSKEKPRKIYLFNIPRTASARDSGREIYSVVEKLKNGILQSSKYEGTTRRFNPPMVAVFSNSYPDPRCLSFDRTLVVTIKDLKCIHTGHVLPRLVNVYNLRE